MEVAIKSFGKQLTEMRRDMVDNRKNISAMLTEVNNFRHGLVEMVDNQVSQINEISEQVIQSAQTNLLLQTGHLTIDLNMCKKRFKFQCEDPVLLAHLQKNQSVVSGKDFSADIVQITHNDEVEIVQNLDTEKNEVYSACLLFGNQHGISIQPNEE